MYIFGIKWAFCCMTYFDIAWPLSPHNHYIVEVVMAILLVYCLFSDFINFPWPFKTFKIAATVR